MKTTSITIKTKSNNIQNNKKDIIVKNNIKLNTKIRTATIITTQSPSPKTTRKTKILIKLSIITVSILTITGARTTSTTTTTLKCQIT